MEPRPRLLDLFCGAGGAAVGYHRAGFDVIGVDIADQPHYPFTFHRGDAMTWPLDGYDAVHASPPCQAYSVSTAPANRSKHPDLIAPVRDRLRALGVPYVIENVPGAPFEGYWAIVCGSGLGMRRIRRHRMFESNVALLGAPCHHRANWKVLSVAGHGERGSGRHGGDPDYWLAARAAAMGIDFMNRDELSQAIPPAYTEHVGAQLLDHLLASRPMTDTPDPVLPDPADPGDDDTDDENADEGTPDAVFALERELFDAEHGVAR